MDLEGNFDEEDNLMNDTKNQKELEELIVNQKEVVMDAELVNVVVMDAELVNVVVMVMLSIRKNN